MTIRIDKVVDGNIVDHQHELSDTTGLPEINSNVNGLLNDREILKEPTGFTAPESVIINYDPTTRKITLTGTVVAYYRGTDISIANPTFGSGWVSSAHTNTTGHVYFLYYDGTNFLWADNSFPGFDKVLIAVVNFGATDKYAVRECHGFMPWQTHKELHETIGTYKTAGGTFPSNQYVLNSTTASNRRPDIDETTITDEDLPSTLPALTSKLYTQYYLTGSAVGAYNLGASDIIPLSTNNPYYNSFSTPNWGQTLMPVNSVATIWVYAIPVTASATSQKYRYLFIQPQWVTQAQNSSAGAIATAVGIENARLPSELNLGTLTVETPELVCIGKIIIDFTTNWRLQAVSLITGNKFSQIGSPSGNFLSTVITNTTLTGSGTPSSPLSIAPKRITSATSGASITPNCDTTDIQKNTAQAEALTINNPTGTPTEGQVLQLSITDDGTARALTYGNGYYAGTTIPMPTTTVVGKELRSLFVWCATCSYWKLYASDYF